MGSLLLSSRGLLRPAVAAAYWRFVPILWAFNHILLILSVVFVFFLAAVLGGLLHSCGDGRTISSSGSASAWSIPLDTIGVAHIGVLEE